MVVTAHNSNSLCSKEQKGNTAKHPCKACYWLHLTEFSIFFFSFLFVLIHASQKKDKHEVKVLRRRAKTKTGRDHTRGSDIRQ
jgi:hypothetical protein